MYTHKNFDEFFRKYYEALKNRRKAETSYNRILRVDNNAPLTGPIRGQEDYIEVEASIGYIFKQIAEVFGE